MRSSQQLHEMLLRIEQRADEISQRERVQQFEELISSAYGRLKEHVPATTDQINSGSMRADRIPGVRDEVVVRYRSLISITEHPGQWVPEDRMDQFEQDCAQAMKEIESQLPWLNAATAGGGQGRSSGTRKTESSRPAGGSSRTSGGSQKSGGSSRPSSRRE